MTRKAAIDIGTNTTRLLIANSEENGTFKELFSRRVITRLGEGLSNRKHLMEGAVQRTIDALALYSKDITDHNCSQVRAVATSAVREAENGKEFLQRVIKETGIKLEVINQQEEAHLATIGVFSGLKGKPEKVVIFDVGGGSTEFILSNNLANPIKIVGLQMGVVHLTERHIKSDPVNSEELESLKAEVDEKLEKVKEEIGREQDFTLIGTAGTPTQFAALDLELVPYDPVAVNGYKMSFSRVKKIFDDLKSKTTSERKAICAMESGREDLIIAGGVILLETMKLFNKDEITISDFGLREGIIVDG